VYFVVVWNYTGPLATLHQQEAVNLALIK
jgi:hypothetical protein